ncbi:MAG: ABC transporter transmembrane domain-containing protein, partial [Bacilli bacterium]
MKKYDRISTYFKENWKVVWLMSITALCFDGLMCFIPQIEGNTINSLNDGDYQKTLILTISFICLVLFVQINRFFKRYLVRVFGNKMALKMRQISFTHLLNNDISYFSGNNTGDILNRNLSDIYDTTEGIRKMTTEFFDTFVLLIGYVTMMFIMDWKVTLYSMIFIILSIASAQFMKYFVYKSTKEYKEYLSIQKQLTISKLNNELNYRGFGVSDNYYADYEKSVGILRKKNMKALMYQSSLEPLYLGVAYIGIFFIAY